MLKIRLIVTPSNKELGFRFDIHETSYDVPIEWLHIYNEKISEDEQKVLGGTLLEFTRLNCSEQIVFFFDGDVWKETYQYSKEVIDVNNKENLQKLANKLLLVLQVSKSAFSHEIDEIDRHRIIQEFFEGLTNKTRLNQINDYFFATSKEFENELVKNRKNISIKRIGLPKNDVLLIVQQNIMNSRTIELFYILLRDSERDLPKFFSKLDSNINRETLKSYLESRDNNKTKYSIDNSTDEFIAKGKPSLKDMGCNSTNNLLYFIEDSSSYGQKLLIMKCLPKDLNGVCKEFYIHY